MPKGKYILTQNQNSYMLRKLNNEINHYWLQLFTKSMFSTKYIVNFALKFPGINYIFRENVIVCHYKILEDFEQN